MNRKARGAICAGFEKFGLTEREREVLNRLACGLLWKSVADDLGITVRTVGFHCANICRKTGAGNCFGAFVKVFEINKTKK